MQEILFFFWVVQSVQANLCVAQTNPHQKLQTMRVSRRAVQIK